MPVKIATHTLSPHIHEPYGTTVCRNIPFRKRKRSFFYAGDSDLSALMHDLKYRHYKGLAEEMGKIVAQELITTPFLSDIDMILPIPMHFLKKSKTRLQSD